MAKSLQRMDPVTSARGLRLLYGLALVAGLIALATTFYRLDAHALWLDEAFSVHDAKRSLYDTLRMRSDRGSAVHPPLHSLLLRISLETCGPTAWCARAPSALAAVAAVPLLVLLSGRLFGWGAAVTATVFWPTLPYLLKYAHQARGYTLLLLLTALTLTFATRCLGWRGKKPTRASAVGLGISAASMVATHLLAGLFVTALAGWTLLWARRLDATSKRHLRLAAIVAAGVSLPFALVALASIGGDTGGRFTTSAGPTQKLGSLMAALATLSSYKPAIPALCVLAVFLSRGRVRVQIASMLLLAGAPLLPLLIRTPEHFVVLRYFMPSVVPVGLVACAGVSALASAPFHLSMVRNTALPARIGLLLGLVAAPLSWFAWQHGQDLRQRWSARSLEPWDEAVAWIDARSTENDLLIATPERLLRYPLEFYRPRARQHPAEVNTVRATVLQQAPERIFVVWSHIDSRRREKKLNAVLAQMGALHYTPLENATFGHRAIIVKMYQR